VRFWSVSKIQNPSFSKIQNSSQNSKRKFTSHSPAFASATLSPVTWSVAADSRLAAAADEAALSVTPPRSAVATDATTGIKVVRQRASDAREYAILGCLPGTNRSLCDISKEKPLQRFLVYEQD